MADPVAENEAEEVSEEAYDSSDPKSVNDARKRSARKRRERLEMVRVAMSSENGRAWFYDLLEFCHMWTTSFQQNDPHFTSFREGERNIGLKVLADIMAASPDQYVTMVKEAKSNG